MGDMLGVMYEVARWGTPVGKEFLEMACLRSPTAVAYQLLKW